MKTMSVAEAAEYFGISKEAVHNRIRRGTLKSVVENGLKMVVVDNTQKKQTPQRRKTLNSNTHSERYYKLLEEQNAKLQEKIDKLEDETRSLRDQKEQMLIAEREKLERIYKEKDEQLKNILTTLSSKFMLSSPSENTQEEEADTFEAEMVEESFVEDDGEIASEVISLKKYLKQNKFSEKKSEKIFKRFKKAAKSDDERVSIVGSKYYIDVAKYDYSDLIK